MGEETIANLITTIVEVPVIGVIGFFLRSFYGSIKEGFKFVKDCLDGLNEKFNDFKLIIQRIDITLTAVQEDLNNTNALALNNLKQISRNELDIATVKTNIGDNTEDIKEAKIKLEVLEKKVIILEEKIK